MLVEILGIIAAGAGAILLLREQRKNRRIKEIEERIPAALLDVSTLPNITFRSAIDHLSKGYGPLSEEILGVKRALDRGIPPRRALTAISGCKSRLLKRAMKILLTGIESGANVSELLRQAAEDIEEELEMERSRRANLTLQKYSVLASTGVFVPAVLGLTERMVAQMVGSGLSTNATVLAVLSAIPINIGIVAISGAVFAALIDGNVRYALQYGAITVPLALLSYALAGGGLVI